MNLPSLTALRAFEAAARTGGFSSAARELNVTHAAVAQQVRALEAHLGLPLIFREGRGMELTDEGARLAAALKEGFGTIAAAIAELTEDERARPLRVTITPTFAAQWLMPRLGGFWSKHPDIPLSLIPDQRVIDLKAERMDLAIRFGTGDWPGLDVEKLMPSFYTIVGAPRLLKGRESLTADEMSDMPWIIEEGWPEQIAWLRAIGVEPDTVSAHKVPTEELALSAARQGYGLHVELSTLLGDDLASGRLKAVYESRRDEGIGYWLVTRPGPMKPALKTFVRWLKGAV